MFAARPILIDVHLIFLDSNILYSRTLRDWVLMLSAEGNRFAAVSSLDCIVEAIGNLREKHPHLDGGTVRNIHQKFYDSLHDVLDDYPGGQIRGVTDEKDWHVIHAAKSAGVDILVTQNSKHFKPVADTVPFDLYTADEFFALVAQNDPQAVEAVTMKQIKYWRKRNAGKEGQHPTLADALRSAQAPGFARIIEDTIRKLGGEVQCAASNQQQGASSNSPAEDSDPIGESVPAPV